MAVNVLLGMTYVNKYIRGIIFMEQMIVLEHLASDALLGRGTKANVTKLFSREAPIDEQNEHATIRVAKLITIPTETESPGVVVPSKGGLMTIERTKTAKSTQRIHFCEVCMRSGQSS